ncbi:MAG: hypothetical protein HY268_08315 [Deltaproteobacteria bacterium]|nr:hypothetical protein [Deltaproteobacteria bacterium]
MKANKDEIENKGFWVQFKEIWQKIIFKGRRFLTWFYALASLAYIWHIIPPEWLVEGPIRQIAITLLVVLFVGVLELFLETRELVENVDKEINALERILSPEVYNLRECIQDFSKVLKNTHPKDRIVMSILGLNLEHALAYMKRYIFKQPTHKNIYLKILLLPEDPKDIKMHPNHQLPKIVAAWCSNMKFYIQQVEKSANDQKSLMKNEGIQLRIEIKQYRVLPILHGFGISDPSNHTYYVSFCRWKPSKQPVEDWDYDWGEDSYHKVASDTKGAAAQDIASIFTGYFEYLWVTSGEPVVVFSYPNVDSYG